MELYVGVRCLCAAFEESANAAVCGGRWTGFEQIPPDTRKQNSMLRHQVIFGHAFVRAA